jgi:hypothetical protein
MRQVIGFTIVATGVSIMFLPVSTWMTSGDGRVHVDCGSALQAMFNGWANMEYECGSAALPYLWIAGGVAAVGMGVAFWGAGRARLLATVGLVVLLTGWISLVALLHSDSATGIGGRGRIRLARA